MDNTNLSDKSFTYELPLNIVSQPNESTARQAFWRIADRLDLGHSILNFSLLSKLFSLILCRTNKASTSQVLRMCLCLDWQCHFCRLPARGPLTFHEDQPHWNQPHCRHLHCCVFASPMSHFSLFLHICVLQPCFTSFSSEAQDFQCGASEKKAQITHSRWKGSTTLWKGPIPTEIGIGPNWPINGWCCSPQPHVNRSCSRGDLPLSKP